MRKFATLNMFKKKLLLIDKGKSLGEIESQINGMGGLLDKITIRYSSKEELGLPRYFASNKKEALDFIKATYSPKWSIILHESINVKNSYEFYIDNEKAVLEHVPGMWESDNKNGADIWIYEKNEVTTFFVNSLRIAKYESEKGIYYKAVKPYTKTEVKNIAERMARYITILRKYWDVKDGVIFHFVGDENEIIHFLNQRKSPSILNCNEQYAKPKEINAVEDLYSWSGEDILLNVNLKRGEEILLYEYIPYLKKNNAKVYIQFGILSHPAILLREMGIDVYPHYAIHSKYIFHI